MKFKGLGNWSRRIKLLAGASAIMAALVVAPVVYGGGRWSGMDPELRVNGEKVNVWVEWPTDMTCEVGNIKVQVLAPLLANVQLVSESSGSFTCPDGTTRRLETHTTIEKALVKAINVSATVESLDLSAQASLSLDGGLSLDTSLNAEVSEFPVNVRVYKNDTPVRDCTGMSNLPVECPPFTN